MTETQKSQILELMSKDYGYKKIAAAMGMPLSTIKSFCKRRRNSISADARPVSGPYCQNCGKPIPKSSRRPRKFCCDKCRNHWWNKHLNLVEKKAIYDFSCLNCGKHFKTYGDTKRKYCSHSCYIEARFGGAVAQ